MNESIKNTILEITEILKNEIPVQFIDKADHIPSLNINVGGLVPNRGQRGVWNHQIKAQILHFFSMMDSNKESISTDEEHFLIDILEKLKLDILKTWDSFLSLEDIDRNLEILSNQVRELDSATIRFIRD